MILDPTSRPQELEFFVAAPASGSRRQSQAVAKKQASFCWPCSPYYLFLLAFLFPNKQPKLPSPTFLVLLPSPAFLVLLALSSHSSQTNNQTNNQRNKQTHKQATNHAPNAKCPCVFWGCFGVVLGLFWGCSGFEALVKHPETGHGPF